MNETLVTIVGNVVDNPRVKTTDKGVDVSSFRIGSAARRWDKDSGKWVDGPKLFVSVTCWRQLAANVRDSLRRGDPIVVSGRLSTHEYEKDGQKRSTFDLEATAVGHDLSRGVSLFRRTRTDSMPTDELGDAEQLVEAGERPGLRVVPDIDTDEEPLLAVAR
jgi:single-strand DNA-binding protein